MSEKKLRIIQISKYDSAGGGASRVAEQLTDELIKNGHHVIHYTRGAAKGFNKVRRPLYGIRTKKMMGWMAKHGWVDVVPFELPRLLLNINIWRADAIHFHDISGTLSPLTITVLSWFKRVVWTLHDMSALTAGCIQPIQCEKYKQGCGSCPQLGEWPLTTAKDKTSFLKSFRNWCVRSTKASIVSPSDWLRTVCKKVAQIEAKVVNNGITIKSLAYSGVEILPFASKHKKTVLLMASHFSSPIKGLDIAIAALSDFSPAQLRLVFVGKQVDIPDLNAFEQISLGYINDDAIKGQIMRESDAMLFCSKAENYPLTLIEALVTGCPVVALDVGGVSEILSLDASSSLAKTPDELACKLKEALKRNKKTPCNHEQFFDIATCMKNYLQVYSGA